MLPITTLPTAITYLKAPIIVLTPFERFEATLPPHLPILVDAIAATPRRRQAVLDWTRGALASQRTAPTDDFVATVHILWGDHGLEWIRLAIGYKGDTLANQEVKPGFPSHKVLKPA